MKFNIDSFYHDSNYGVVKFKGYLDGKLLFERYEKSFLANGPGSGWQPTGQRVNIDPSFMEKRAAIHRITPIPPPT